MRRAVSGVGTHPRVKIRFPRNTSSHQPFRLQACRWPFYAATMATVQITLSDDLAQEAAREGLLDSSKMEAILREQLAAARIDRMQSARAQMAAKPLLPMTAAEIEAEIEAFRTEQRRAAGA